MKYFLLVALLLSQVPAYAGSNRSQSGYSKDVMCFRDVYREDYIPGTRDQPGYVRRTVEKVEVPCSNGKRIKYRNLDQQEKSQPKKVDDNSCIEGSVLGGLAGGGLGAALSRGSGRWWAIPTGIVGGVLVGCQIDGG